MRFAEQARERGERQFLCCLIKKHAKEEKKWSWIGNELLYFGAENGFFGGRCP